jgi:hypothetical protein
MALILHPSSLQITGLKAALWPHTSQNPVDFIPHNVALEYVLFPQIHSSVLCIVQQFIVPMLEY